jgi:hypothetical protein
MNAFTHEQEVRIAEIVVRIMTGIGRQQSKRVGDDLAFDLNWAAFNAGFSLPEGLSDPRHPSAYQDAEDV